MTIIKPEDIRADIVDLLESMGDSDKWPIPVQTIGALIEHTVKNWQRAITGELTGMIKEWEDKLADDDKSLYSLGLRHARDIVQGVDIDR